MAPFPRSLIPCDIYCVFSSNLFRYGSNAVSGSRTTEQEFIGQLIEKVNNSISNLFLKSSDVNILSKLNGDIYIYIFIYINE